MFETTIAIFSKIAFAVYCIYLCIDMPTHNNSEWSKVGRMVYENFITTYDQLLQHYINHNGDVPYIIDTCHLDTYETSMLLDLEQKYLLKPNN